MKNLENYGVCELNAKELQEVNGGYTINITRGNLSVAHHYSAGGHFMYTRYYRNGRLIRPNGQGIQLYGSWSTRPELINQQT